MNNQARHALKALYNSQTDLLDELFDMIDHDLPYGHIVLDDNMAAWWTSIQWVSPPAARKEYPKDFLRLGQQGWWVNEEQKELFLRVRSIAGDLFPTRPNEHCDLCDIEVDTK